ncbi:MAG: hypothetical protein QOG38_2034 [Hyphomicrobiales bacterium]|jgi:hypothetical protein|nr:hypothetical protein [Hyphomicrobiales bacterium]
MMIAGTHLHMTFRTDRSRGLRALGAGFMLAAFVSVASAQPPSGPPPVIYAPPEQAAPAPASPRVLPTPQEVFSGIGRLIDQSIANVNAGVKGAGDTLGSVPSAAGDIAKGAADAAGTIARLPGTNVVKGWERCAEAPNGAPDCELASVALCKAKGYERGKSLDITSAHKCPAQVWLEGRQPAVGECRQESFVSRAICQ